MKHFFLSAIVLISISRSEIFSQNQGAPKLYAHKVIVDSVLQTKAYTYLKVVERIKEKDSLQWLALPLIKPKIGDIYYFDSGLQMGEFKSRELDRTFNDILFLPSLGTSPDMADKNIVPAPFKDTISQNAAPIIIHKVVVKEVIQTSGYTYLHVKEGDKENWLAIVKIPAIVGQTYKYNDAAPMKDFTSKELKRTFDEVFFIAKLTLVANDKSETLNSSKNKKKPKEITIANLWKNKKSYAGKTVQINGKVTKYSPDILGKTWIHIEDGTAFSGKFDLTVTTDQEVKVDDNITVEGAITLDKNFGSGYFFEVIMEDATIQGK